MAGRYNMPLRPSVRKRAEEALEVERIVRAGLKQRGFTAHAFSVEIADARIEALEWALGRTE